MRRFLSIFNQTTKNESALVCSHLRLGVRLLAVTLKARGTTQINALSCNPTFLDIANANRLPFHPSAVHQGTLGSNIIKSAGRGKGENNTRGSFARGGREEKDNIQCSFDVRKIFSS
jgi:hypothetical protein